MHGSSWRRFASLTIGGSLLFAACGADDTTNQAGQSTEVEDVNKVINDLRAAELAGDKDKVVTLITENGAQSLGYDSKNAIRDGDAELAPPETLSIVETTVSGDEAEALVDATFEAGLYRLKMLLVKDGGKWLVDGLEDEDVGSADAPAGAVALDVKAVDYGYEFDAAKTASGNFTISFMNEGTEQHEITLFSIPAGTDAAAAATALKDVDGGALANIPAGYGLIGHLVFVEAGESHPFVFAETLKPGSYAFACFIPTGGLNEEMDAPNDPAGTPHIQSGMLSTFEVG